MRAIALSILVAAAACGGDAARQPPSDGGVPPTPAPVRSGSLAASLTDFAPHLDGTMTITVQSDGTVTGRFAPSAANEPARSVSGAASGNDVHLDLLLDDPRFDFATAWHLSGTGTTTGIEGTVSFNERTDAASGFVSVYQ